MERSAATTADTATTDSENSAAEEEDTVTLIVTVCAHPLSCCFSLHSFYPYPWRHHCINHEYGTGILQPECILNHAAVNPLFSFFESITHQEDFADQYRFMDDKEATQLFESMISTSDQNTYPLLNEATFKKVHPTFLSSSWRVSPAISCRRWVLTRM